MILVPILVLIPRLQMKIGNPVLNSKFNEKGKSRINN